MPPPPQEQEHPVALVTGASSGIGLALTQHLLANNWAVVACDINPPPPDLAPHLASALSDTSSSTPLLLFITTDVSSWPSQASAFARAFAWRKRLDFCALNAGIDDRDDIFGSVLTAGVSSLPINGAVNGNGDGDGEGQGVEGAGGKLGIPEPREPNMQTFAVNLFGPYYGIKLAAHYMALNTPLGPAPTSNFPCPQTPLNDGNQPPRGGGGGKIILTASSAGLYAVPPIPQYTSAKHGLVGLVRALAPTASAASHIALNAVCPAIVATGLAPPGLMAAFAPEQVTPMSTVLRAFDELGLLTPAATAAESAQPEAAGAGSLQTDATTGGSAEKKEVPVPGSRVWLETGPRGQIVECSLANLYFRDEIEKADGAQQYMAEGALEAWARAYGERNRAFAAREWRETWVV